MEKDPQLLHAEYTLLAYFAQSQHGVRPQKSLYAFSLSSLFLVTHCIEMN